MVGQDKLTTKLNELSLRDFPHSLILSGDIGCGKHTFVTEISKHFEIPVRYISDVISEVKSANPGKNYTSTELLDGILSATYQTSFPTLYVFDELKDSYMNIMLKFMEEPSESTYAVILCESESEVLSTVRNRCQVWRFDPYPHSILEQFCSEVEDKTLLLTIFNTPGQVLDMAKADIKELYDDAVRILTNIHAAYLSNVLVLSERSNIAYKKADIGIPIQYLAKILVKVSLDLYITNELPISIIKKSNDFSEDCKQTNIDKKKLYENYLLSVRDDIRAFKTKN